MLYDKDFLLQLDSYPHREVYARITALTFQETPVERIEGRVTQGSINIDGSSAVRRSCSLTIAAPEFNYHDYYWGLNTKFKLEVGLTNYVNPVYPDVIWFSQGIYLITSLSTARNANSFNLTIQGKDKMCLLNGEVGGSLESSVDFGTIQEEDIHGNWTIKKVPIVDIIKNMVHTYAGEPYHNIIINDLDTYGLELLEYRYDEPMYLYRLENTPIYENVQFESKNYACEVIDKSSGANCGKYLFKDLPTKYLDPLNDRLVGQSENNYVMKIYASENAEDPIDDNRYHLAKVEYGQTAGYKFMDLTYAGDLIANIGENLTSVLDKIRNMLVEFEYFYNLEGQFVFQKKQSFKEAIWQFKDPNKLYTPPEYSYEFYGGRLITGFNHNPNLANLKNDYSIWGQREGISGGTIPIHLRYAIDKKPIRYKSIMVDYGELDLDENGQVQYDDDGNKKWIRKGVDADAIDKYNLKYNTAIGSQSSVLYSINDENEEFTKVNDWREVIYQMTEDYYRYNFLDDFELKVAAANLEDYPTGRTGYEQYYVDIKSFWRELYDPTIIDREAELLQEQITLNTNIAKANTMIRERRKLVIAYDTEPQSSVLTQAIEKWKQRQEAEALIRTLENDIAKWDEQLITCEENLKLIRDAKEKFYLDDSEGEKLMYWNKSVFLEPDRLNFWFDFLDTEGELQQFSVKAVGSRPKSINDTSIKSIYFRETPSVIYQEPDTNNEHQQETGYRYIQIGTMYDNMFSLSPQGKGAKDRLDELLYQHGYCVENVTISTVPIYHLQPNTRIYLHDDDVGLDGDYIATKFTIPLTFGGVMSITATKAAENNIIT